MVPPVGLLLAATVVAMIVIVMARGNFEST